MWGNTRKGLNYRCQLNNCTADNGVAVELKLFRKESVKKGSLKGGAIVAKTLIDLEYPAVVKCLHYPQIKAEEITQSKRSWWGPVTICDLGN